MNMATKIPDQRSEQGWVLIIGLVVLVMLTIIAMALMRTTLLEEKMAGASRDINLSFEAAEAGLRGAEAFIQSLVDDSAFTATGGGLYAQGASSSDLEPSPFGATWDDGNSRTLSNTPTGVASPPRYMIKKISEKTRGKINISGYGETDLTTKTVIFRITVRGTGSRDNTVTILRGHYAATY